jgi:hypothetical protein
MPDLKQEKTLAKVRITDGLKPYKIDEPDADTTYMLYTDDQGTLPQQILKISISGTVTTFEVALDLWANRATASYLPING